MRSATDHYSRGVPRGSPGLCGLRRGPRRCILDADSDAQRDRDARSELTGFNHLRGYRVVVDFAKCRGLRRYGVRHVSGRTAFHGFKCTITTDDESRYTLWSFGTSRSSFYLKWARLDWSSEALVENCIEYTDQDWEKCLGKYRP